VTSSEGVGSGVWLGRGIMSRSRVPRSS
jgi:hypothetical protein